MRVLVTGPRGWVDRAVVEQALADALVQPPEPSQGGAMVLVSGGCPEGLDALAEAVAADWLWQVESHPVDWRNSGGGVAMFRNSHLVNLGADLCVAFAMPCDDARCSEPKPHLTHGTRDCARKAKEAEIPVRWYRPSDGVR